MKIYIYAFVVLLLLQNTFGGKKLLLLLRKEKEVEFPNRSNVFKPHDCSYIWKNKPCPFENKKNNILKASFARFIAVCKEPALLNLFKEVQSECDVLKKINSIEEILSETGVILELVKNDYMRKKIKNINFNMLDIFENLRLLGEFLKDHQVNLTKIHPEILDAVIFQYIAKPIIKNNKKLKFVISRQLNKISFDNDIYEEKQEIMSYFNRLDDFHFLISQNKDMNIAIFMKALSLRYNQLSCKGENKTKNASYANCLAQLRLVTEDDLC